MEDFDFTNKARDDLKAWNKRNPEFFKKRILKLFESIKDSPEEGIGNPERLKHFREREIWSRRINLKDRLVYELVRDKNNQVELIVIISMLGHYNDK